MTRTDTVPAWPDAAHAGRTTSVANAIEPAGSAGPAAVETPAFDPVLWEQDVYLAPIAARLPAIAVLSVDVFDTLLVRLCGSPEDVFLETGRRARARGLLRPGVSPAEFARLRQHAARRAHGVLGREPHLEEIYQQMPAALVPPRTATAIEEEVERASCVLNPSVASLIARCAGLGIRVVLLSDMYLGERRVRALLAQAGFDADRWTDHVIVSVDHGGSKRTGELFTRVRRLFPEVAPSALLHLGDNRSSDVTAPRAQGLPAVHYDAVRDDPMGVRVLERLVHGDLLPELTAMRGLAGSRRARLDDADHPWFLIGATILGPFLAALVDWALDLCDAGGVTLIAPLMREGHALAPMLRRAAEARGLAIEVRPLHVSRQAVAFAGLEDTGAALAPALLDGRRRMTVREVLALIDLPVPGTLAAHGDAPIETIDTCLVAPGTTLRAALVAHLARPDIQVGLARTIRARRDGLLRHVDRVAGDHRTIATLDIGFFGQIARGLDRACRAGGRAVTAMHLLAIGYGPIRDHLLDGHDIRVFAAGYGEDTAIARTIHRSAAVLEQLLHGRDGSTIGYVPETGEPLLERNGTSDDELRAKGLVQDGMRVYHELWVSWRATHPHTLASLPDRRDAWCRLIHRLIDVPSPREVDCLGTLHADLNFGSRAVVPFCPDTQQPAIARRGGASAAYRQGAAAIPAIWPQGLIGRLDPGAIAACHADRASRPFVADAFALAREVRARGLTRVIGYGTGELAVAFVDAARALGIQVDALVDRDPARQGAHVGNVPILDLEAAIALAPPAWVVLSRAHAEAIAATLRDRGGRGAMVTPIITVTAGPDGRS